MRRVLVTRQSVLKNKRIQPNNKNHTKQCVKQNQRKDKSFPIPCMAT